MPDFIIIDDDPINNLICTRIIQIIDAKANIQAYTNPVQAIEQMRTQFSGGVMNNIVLFLDINMPELSGWEVLDEFSTFPDQLKQHFKIYILSSSVDALDKQKASYNPHVSGYIAKPLSKSILQGIL